MKSAKGKGKKGGKGKGKGKKGGKGTPASHESLDDELDKFMGGEAVNARLDDELEAFMKKDEE